MIPLILILCTIFTLFHQNHATTSITYGPAPFLQILAFERGLSSSERDFDYGAAYINDLGTRLSYTHICALETYSVAYSKTGALTFMGTLTSRFGENTLTNFPRVAGIIDTAIHGEIDSMQCGGMHVLMRAAKGRLLVFGAGDYGQLGLGLDPQIAPVPMVHYVFENVTKVSAAGRHSMALDSQGRVYHWGDWSSASQGGIMPYLDEMPHPPSGAAGTTEALFYPLQIIMHQKSIAIASTPLGGLIVGQDECLYAFGTIFPSGVTHQQATKLDYPCTIQDVYASEYDIIVRTRDEQLLRSSRNGRLDLIRTPAGFPHAHSLTSINMYNYLDAFHFDNDEMWLLVQRNQSILPVPPYDLPKQVEINGFGKIRDVDCNRAHCIAIDSKNHLLTVGGDDISRQSCKIPGASVLNEWTSCNIDFLDIINVKLSSMEVVQSPPKCRILLRMRNNEGAWGYFFTHCEDAAEFTQLTTVSRVYPFRANRGTQYVAELTLDIDQQSTSDTNRVLKAVNIDQYLLQLGVSPDCDMTDEPACLKAKPTLLSNFTDFENIFYGTYYQPGKRGLDFSVLAVYHVAPGVKDEQGAVWIVRQLSVDTKDYRLDPRPLYRIPKASHFFATNKGGLVVANEVFVASENRLYIFTAVPEAFHEFQYAQEGNAPEIVRITSGLGRNATYVLTRGGEIHWVHFHEAESRFDLVRVSPSDGHFFVAITSLEAGHTVYGLTATGEVFAFHTTAARSSWQQEELDIRNRTSEIITDFKVVNVDGYEGLTLTYSVSCQNQSASDFRVCSERGLCITIDKCSCYTGNYGKACSYTYQCAQLDPDNDNVCSGHGECVSQDKCQCVSGYYGSTCLYTFACEGRKTQKLGVCACQSGYDYVFGICLRGDEITLIILCTFAAACLFIICMVICCAVCLLCCVSTHFAIRKHRSDAKHKEILDNKQHLLMSYERDAELDLIDTDKAFFELKKDLFEIDQQELKIEKKLGSGGQGTVFKAMWAGKQCAVKYFNCKLLTGERIFDEFEREASLMSSIRHPCIVTFYGATLSFPRIGLILEYAPNGSVDELISSSKVKTLSKAQVFKILIDVCDAMIFLHSRKTPIIHRDLKWQNVLLWTVCDSNGDEIYNAKVTDFGMSKIQDAASNESMTSNVGTSLYVAPENFRGSRYDEKVDVYAFGMMIFELLVGKMNPWSLDENLRDLPAVSLSSRAANDANFRPNVEHLRAAGFSAVVELCEQCWAHDPTERLPFKDVKLSLERALKEMVGEE